MPRHLAPSAEVLLATYNAERFLAPLMRSLLDQDWQNVRIVVRDDGSDDATGQLLTRYEGLGVERRPTAPNRGAARSYMELLAEAPAADVTLFADQDDVWYPDKVRRALAVLGTLPPDRPGLYCTSVDYVDADLAPIGRSPAWPRAPSFANALVENIAMGCTIALNRPAAALLKAVPYPDEAVMHDWWAYLVVSAFGTVIFDPEPSLAFRVHGEHLAHIPGSPVARAWTAVMRETAAGLLSRAIDQALAFDRLYGDDLKPTQRTLIERLAATRKLTGRVRFTRESEIYRQFRADDIVLRAMVLAGRAASRAPA
ncbi:MAG: glycosyltransferase [Hyphomicrobium sp.]|nr:glycosyltransferase [Hyphomicrobium sp.]